MSVNKYINGSLKQISGTYYDKEWSGTLAELQIAINNGLITEGTTLFITDDESTTSDTSIQTALNKINNQLGGVSFDVDGDGNRGYYKGDGTFVPFKSGVDFSKLPFNHQYVTQTKSKTLTVTFPEKPNIVLARYSRATSLALGYLGYCVFDFNKRAALCQQGETGEPTLREDMISAWTDNSITIIQWSTSYDYKWDFMAFQNGIL